jgi:pimeloyl-ACP methyl ester carboxylesterase
MDALGVESAHVFGMSMGGMIAQELALEHPERVDALILGATMAGGPGATFPDVSMIGQFVGLAKLPIEQAIERGLTFFYSEAFIADNRDLLVTRAMHHLPLAAPPHSLQRQLMAVMGFNAHHRLGNIQHPTLILHGDADMIVPFANSAVLSSRIAGSEMIPYPDVGHGMLFERAPEINTAVLKFLSRHRTVSANAKV